MIKMITALLIAFAFSSICYALPHVHPITWKGQKWEYLVEHPTDIQTIDTVRMEHILDDAGQHGWELIEVTSEYHFYVFYFKRPLSNEKLAEHRQHLLTLHTNHEKKHAKLYEQLKQAQQQQAQSQKVNQ